MVELDMAEFDIGAFQRVEGGFLQAKARGFAKADIRGWMQVSTKVKIIVANTKVVML